LRTFGGVIQHVSLAVPPRLVEACGRFWALLGFAPVDPPPSLRDRAAWWQKGVQQVHLLRAEEGAPGPGGSHVALEVDDWDEVLGRLREAGFAPEERERHWGSPRAYVHEPAGYLVELMAWAPTAPRRP
jgi:catechol 2,3-dioxygenase-like lactoylglutathione lyase family enzyme